MNSDRSTRISARINNQLKITLIYFLIVMGVLAYITARNISYASKYEVVRDGSMIVDKSTKTIHYINRDDLDRYRDD